MSSALEKEHHLDGTRFLKGENNSFLELTESLLRVRNFFRLLNSKRLPLGLHLPQNARLQKD
jgi:hypothetical protein